MVAQYPGNRWFHVLLPAAALMVAGCSEAVVLSHESGQGAVVTYLYKEERGGPMGSPHRREALKVMADKCPSGYTVVKDGQVPSYSSGSSVEGAEGEEGMRRWGIQFECKAGGDDKRTGGK
ncbi:MAG: conserved exported protein of unknown function [Nitrospira sp.]|nr:MAG: conserved exported protein of unknown function [Nitrospira sp.]